MTLPGETKTVTTTYRPPTVHAVEQESVNSDDVTTDCDRQRLIHIVFEIALVSIIFLLTMLLLCFLYQFQKLKQKMTLPPVTSQDTPAERIRLKQNEAT